ncbi:nucleotidyl transferase AbiEii/AbiGii toxin family protein [Candidatus Gottesmanbacteria bacterium]|nr:nucleotidyl transferase AbiEii/AbiGii toxin family protein [Candidatus Gottesmanbacteria bacterium]
MEQAAKNDELTRWYYLTGGTALSEFYLHHRLSEDIDFFTRNQVIQPKVDAFLQDIEKEAGIVRRVWKQISGLYTYSLTYEDGEMIKVDFNEYDFPQVEQGTMVGKLRVDSVYDIAINKLYTMFSRKKARDYVDLFVLLSPGDFSMEQLLSRIPDKFGALPTDLTIMRSFMAAQDLTDYPTMLVPFDRKQMIDFFLSEAKKLEGKIFKSNT